MKHHGTSESVTSRGQHKVGSRESSSIYKEIQEASTPSACAGKGVNCQASNDG